MTLCVKCTRLLLSLFFSILTLIHAQAEAQPRCIDANALFEAMPADVRGTLVLTPASNGPGDESSHWLPAPEVLRINLDDEMQEESVLIVNRPDHAQIDSNANGGRSIVAFFRCTTRPTYLGVLQFTNEQYYDGFYDDTPGVAVARAEALPGVPHPFLRLEHVDVRGGVDPRFLSREFLLVHIVNNQVVTAFRANTFYESVTGPEREVDITTRRRIVYTRGNTARIRYRLQRSERGRPMRTVCETVYAYRNGTFVNSGRDCD